MLVPISWLKDFVKIKLPLKDLMWKMTEVGLTCESFKKIGDETILDVEVTPNRPDWMGIIGIAREVAAIQGLKIKDLKLKDLPKKSASLPIKLIPNFNLFERWTGIIIKDVEIKPSPKWLADRIRLMGHEPINNVIDITNYVMVELGQTLHAQDLAKFRKQEIVIRRAKLGEKLTTFLGDVLELDPEGFVLTQDDVPTVVGGIVGGKETGIDDTTTDIILDAGNYNQVAIRQVSRKLKIQNESVLRNDKFLHPELSAIAIQRATGLIVELAGGDYYENIDWYPSKPVDKRLVIRFARLKALSGMEFEAKQVKTILENLGYEIMEENIVSLTVKVPYFRTDVEVEDDLIADVLRINDYEKIPLQMLSNTPPKDITPDIYKFFTDE